MRQCREGVGLSTERWYGVDGDGGISILGSKPGSGMGMGWNVVLKLDYTFIYLIC